MAIKMKWNHLLKICFSCFISAERVARMRDFDSVSWTWIHESSSSLRRELNIHSTYSRIRGLALGARVIHSTLKYGNISLIRIDCVCAKEIRSSRCESSVGGLPFALQIFRFLFSPLNYVVRLASHTKHGLTLFADFDYAHRFSCSVSATRILTY